MKPQAFLTNSCHSSEGNLHVMNEIMVKTERNALNEMRGNSISEVRLCSWCVTLTVVSSNQDDTPAKY